MAKKTATQHLTLLWAAAGSYDGAETCELVGSFLLSQLQNLDLNIGLYRDDGLAISNAAPRDTENIKKETSLRSMAVLSCRAQERRSREKNKNQVVSSCSRPNLLVVSLPSPAFIT